MQSIISFFNFVYFIGKGPLIFLRISALDKAGALQSEKNSKFRNPILIFGRRLEQFVIDFVSNRPMTYTDNKFIVFDYRTLSIFRKGY